MTSRPLAYPNLDCGVFPDRCSLWWGRDEVARHFHRVILFRSAQSYFLLTATKGDHDTGLGGLTFLQLTTTYVPVIAGRSIGYVFLEKDRRYPWPERFQPIQIFCVWNRCCWTRRRTSLVGAPKPWCTNRPGVIISKSSPVRCYDFLIVTVTQVLPLTIPLAYFFLLPQPSSISNQDEEDDEVELLVASSTEYAPLPTDDGEGETTKYRHPRTVALSASDKWRLVKPMIPKYMAPLCEHPLV